MPEPQADRSGDYESILEVLGRCRRVLITTHTSPDGDAIGSCAAAVLGLKAAGIASEVLLLSHLPRKYAFVFHDSQIPHLDVEAGWPESLGLERFDALLVLDTGTWSQLPGLKERIAGWDVPRIVVDHHLTQQDWATHKLVDTEAAATGEIVAGLLERAKVPLDRAIATALYVALVSDTGWFQFSNTRPLTLRLAADLMEAGVDTDRLYQLLNQSERAQRIALQTRAMQSLQLLAGGRLAVMQLRREDFQQAQATLPDTENLVNVPLQIGTVEVAMLLTEPPGAAAGPSPGPIRVSLRSKGSIDVAAFAQRFGGGGHARAAGLKLDGSFDAARQRVIDSMIARIQSA